MSCEGRAMAQAVNRWLPASTARIRVQATSCGICGWQVALGQVCSEYIGFSANHSTDSSTLIIIQGWSNRPVVAWVIVDLVLLHPKEEEEEKKMTALWI
jgi:hypothetical protein